MQTSQSRLHIQWQSGPGDNTFGIETLEDAIEFLSGQGGGKPLLIYRESSDRDEKVAKLLGAALKSERFILASHWFHCVKVGDEVLAEEHPMQGLFDGRNAPALVLTTVDHKKSVSFLGTSSQKVKWAPIASVLKAAYKKNPTRAVKELEKLLCTFDLIDAKENNLQKQLTRARENEDARKVAKLEEEIAEVEKERQEAFAEEEKLRDLVLRAAAAD